MNRFNTLLTALKNHAQKTPNKPFIMGDFGSISYAGFYDLATQKAKELSNFTGYKDRVLVELSLTPDYLATQAALWMLNAIFIPVSNKISKNTLNDIITQTKPKIFIHSSGIQILDNSAKTPSISPLPNDISEILFTSGSTNAQKGIVLTHQNCIAVAQNVIHATGAKNDNIELILSPLSHSHGLRRYYANLLNGASVILHENVLDYKAIFSKLNRFNATSIDAVPAAIKIILELASSELAKLNHQLKYIQLGAAPLLIADKLKLKELLPDIMLIDGYGSTESGVSINQLFSSAKNKPNCIGKPSYNSTIFLANGDGDELKNGEPGLIAIKSPANMLGYLRGVKNSEIICNSPFGEVVLSDDIARFDEDGDIILLGRISDMINVGGKKIFAQNIQNTANAHPLIKESACIAIDDAILGQIPKLFIVLKNAKNSEVATKVAKNTPFSIAGFKEFLAATLQSYEIPQNIKIINRIPRTDKGPINKSELINEPTDRYLKW